MKLHGLMFDKNSKTLGFRLANFYWPCFFTLRLESPMNLSLSSFYHWSGSCLILIRHNQSFQQIQTRSKKNPAIKVLKSGPIKIFTEKLLSPSKFFFQSTNHGGILISCFMQLHTHNLIYVMIVKLNTVLYVNKK